MRQVALARPPRAPAAAAPRERAPRGAAPSDAVVPSSPNVSLLRPPPAGGRVQHLLGQRALWPSLVWTSDRSPERLRRAHQLLLLRPQQHQSPAVRQLPLERRERLRALLLMRGRRFRRPTTVGSSAPAQPAATDGSSAPARPATASAAAGAAAALPAPCPVLRQEDKHLRRVEQPSGMAQWSDKLGLGRRLEDLRCAACLRALPSRAHICAHDVCNTARDPHSLRCPSQSHPSPSGVCAPSLVTLSPPPARSRLSLCAPFSIPSLALRFPRLLSSVLCRERVRPPLSPSWLECASRVRPLHLAGRGPQDHLLLLRRWHGAHARARLPARCTRTYGTLLSLSLCGSRERVASTQHAPPPVQMRSITCTSRDEFLHADRAPRTHI